MRRWFLHDGGLWVRIAGRVRGFFLTRPFVRVPVITGGSDGMPSQGSYLMIGDAAGSPGGGFLEISEVTNIGGGGDDVERIDFTHLRSPGRTREFKPSFITPGVITFTIQYIPTDASHQRLLSLKESGDEVDLREVFPDATGWDHRGYVSGVEKAGQDVGGKITLNISFQRTGLVDYTGTGGTGSPA